MARSLLPPLLLAPLLLLLAHAPRASAHLLGQDAALAQAAWLAMLAWLAWRM
jgi:hypothetical protein